MCIRSIRLTHPFCSASQEKQTKCSLIVRTTAVGLGAIALLIGVLIFSGIPGLSTLGTTGGSLFSALGALMLLTGAFLRCIKESNQQNEHSTKLSRRRSEEDPSKAKISTLDQVNDQNKKNSCDFEKITPANYEQYIALNQAYNFWTASKGDFVFEKKAYDRDFTPSPEYPHGRKKGDIYLSGNIHFEENGSFGGGDLDIKDGQFIHYPQMAEAPVHFSNLKEFFDYLFLGNFYQGECTRDMEFFALKTVDGTEIRYYNPYNKL